MFEGWGTPKSKRRNKKWDLIDHLSFLCNFMKYVQLHNLNSLELNYLDLFGSDANLEIPYMSNTSA